MFSKKKNICFCINNKKKKITFISEPQETYFKEDIDPLYFFIVLYICVNIDDDALKTYYPCIFPVKYYCKTQKCKEKSC